MPVADDTARAVSLSALEFDVVTEHLGIDAVPLVLKVPSPGRTHSERAELVDSVWKALSARGLGDPGRLDAELEWMVRSLARPQREVDGRIWLHRSVRVLASASGDDEAVLVIKDVDTLTLRSAAATGLPREALSALPPLPAGAGRSVSVRSAALDAAAEEAGNNVVDLQAALRRHGVRPDDAETLTTMIGQSGANGQFGAAARDRWGKRTRASHVVGFFDSPHGRYVQLRRESTSGDPWSTIAPVDGRRMTAHLEELLADVVS